MQRFYICWVFALPIKSFYIYSHYHAMYNFLKANKTGTYIIFYKGLLELNPMKKHVQQTLKCDTADPKKYQYVHSINVLG